MSNVELLQRCRVKEREQAHFYRALAAVAESRGEAGSVERLNELHADEQHHLSRLTARILELGEIPADLEGVERVSAPFEEWPEVARQREAEEIERYRELLAGQVDEDTRRVIEEILESELHHHEELRGKWMSA